MKTIALRFSDKFAPECGTIGAHEHIIQETGYAWYGKLGSKIASSVFEDILNCDNPRILLIHSGTSKRYWAYVDKIQHETPDKKDIPEYYRNMSDKFNTWFRVTRFERAPQDIMSKCTVVSSGATLGNSSKHSMSPYFKINAPDN